MYNLHDVIQPNVRTIHKQLLGYHGIRRELKERALCTLRLRRQIPGDSALMASGCPRLSMEIYDSLTRSLSTENEDRTAQNGDLREWSPTVYTDAAVMACTNAE